MEASANPKREEMLRRPLRILLHGGDNMLGRAVQLSFPIQAKGEEWIRDSCTARHYLEMCLNHPSGDRRNEHLGLDDIRSQNSNGGAYLWGDYRGLIVDPPPNVRILNLETAVTQSIDNPDIPRTKGINYHLHSSNYENVLNGFRCETHSNDPQIPPSPLVVSCANNHAIDFGRQAVDQETIPLLERLNKKYQDSFQSIGLGQNLADASKPATLAFHHDDVSKFTTGTVQVFAFSTSCSGTPRDWWADDNQSDLVGLPGLCTTKDVAKALEIVQQTFARAATLTETPFRIVSIHWGPNWALKGETKEQIAARRDLAHHMIDDCGVDLIYGHSSHHARGIEVYHEKLILYGAGDIINDYEGFENPGEERYNQLGGIYIVDFDSTTKQFEKLFLVPMHMNRLQLQRVTRSSSIWRPQQQTLVQDATQIDKFGQFVNEMSLLDVGGGGTDKGVALSLQVCECDDVVPGGPILCSTTL